MLSLIIDYIGWYYPFILIIFTLFLFRNIKKYLIVLLGGIIFTNILNIILKLLLQQPRPSQDSRILEIAISHGNRINFNKYGMPSGHAQNCGFLLGYVTLVFKNIHITGFYLILSLLTMIQRVSSNSHTSCQVFIGFIIGLITSYLLYLVGNKYIIGHINEKNDDNAPI